MTDDELQDPNTWNDESATVHPPVADPRAVVSVAFARDDFDRVSEAAQARGMKVSAYIREAAVQRATGVTVTITSNPSAAMTSWSAGITH